MLHDQGTKHGPLCLMLDKQRDKEETWVIFSVQEDIIDGF